MKTLSAILSVAALTLSMSALAKQELPMVYLDTDPGDPPASVAVLVVNSKAANNATLKCGVIWVVPGSGEKLEKELDRTTIVVMRPGHHTVTASYTGMRNGVFNTIRVFEAGKRYRVGCEGRSFRTMEIAVEQI